MVQGLSKEAIRKSFYVLFYISYSFLKQHLLPKIPLSNPSQRIPKTFMQGNIHVNGMPNENIPHLAWDIADV